MPFRNADRALMQVNRGSRRATKFPADILRSEMEPRLPTTCLRYALIAAVMLAATSAFAADPDHGKTLAERWCTGCHLVGPNQAGATTEAPPFAFVARRPDFDETRLAFFLLDPHPKMPNMQLTRDDAKDLAAYIATLGPRGPAKSAPPKPSKRAEN
jgi:mono/diheme cytochrome c family protein